MEYRVRRADGEYRWITNQAVPRLASDGTFLGYVGPLVFGTTLAALIALVIAVPFAIGIALFVSHYAPRRLAAPVAYLMDLLAAIPSVVYGLWGGGVLNAHIVPIQEWLHAHLSFIPLFAGPPSV